jgi:hypothetical protein
MGILRKDARRQTDVVPPHMKTSAQWAAEEDLSHPHARRLIQGLVGEGKWEMQKFAIESGCGVYPTRHYGPKKQQKSKR